MILEDCFSKLNYQPTMIHDFDLSITVKLQII